MPPNDTFSIRQNFLKFTCVGTNGYLMEVKAKEDERRKLDDSYLTDSDTLMRTT